MPDDDLDHIPSIVPTRDGVPQRSSSKTRAGKGRGEAPKRGGPPSGGAGLLARLCIAIALAVAAVACAWAFQLQQQLEEANEQMVGYADRITDLEDRLSDTDEGMNQNAAVQAVKVSELESEVRKLWDNVWKKSKERFAQLEAASGKHSSSIKSMEKSLASAESQLSGVAGDLAKLKSVAGDMSRLMSSAKANQAEVERVADTLNRINLDLTKLEKRVKGNEEWVGSINAFRRQVNASLAEVQSALRTMQAAP
ncbi:MAG: chromosome segregation ATPase [Halioglobus sp.]|jgi:chromosome segregation ATPase